MSKINKLPNNLIQNIINTYTKLGSKITDEKRMEILSMLMKLFSKIDNNDIPRLDEIKEECKTISMKLISNIVDYTIRQDLLPINLCVNALNYINDIEHTEKFVESFLDVVNANWEKFEKTEDFIGLTFEIAKLLEKNNITKFRDGFVRLFLNTLLCIRYDYWNRILVSINIASYLKSIDMLSRGEGLLEKELRSIPIKLFIAKFDSLCKALFYNELLQGRTLDVLINIVRKSVPKEYIDDLLVHIVMKFYEKSNLDELESILDKFEDKKKILLKLCYTIEQDLKTNTSAGGPVRAKTILHRIISLYGEVIDGEHDSLYYSYMSLSKYLDYDKFAETVDNISADLANKDGIDVEEFSNFILSLLS